MAARLVNSLPETPIPKSSRSNRVNRDRNRLTLVGTNLENQCVVGDGNLSLAHSTHPHHHRSGRVSCTDTQLNDDAFGSSRRSGQNVTNRCRCVAADSSRSVGSSDIDFRGSDSRRCGCSGGIGNDLNRRRSTPRLQFARRLRFRLRCLLR